MHRTRAGLARQSQDHAEARRAIDDGLHIAQQHGLRLLHVDLLVEWARLSMAERNPDAAEDAARTTHRMAAAADCQYRWGEAEAGFQWARALAALKRYREARRAATANLALRRALQHPETERVLELMESIP